jgi:hypothetical protein
MPYEDICKLSTMQPNRFKFHHTVELYTWVTAALFTSLKSSNSSSITIQCVKSL